MFPKLAKHHRRPLGAWPIPLAAAALIALRPAPTSAEPTFNRRTGLFEPPFSELQQAVDSGDRSEIGRWAARIGPARLAQALRGPDRARSLAALVATPLLAGGVRLLDAVIPLLSSADSALVEQAARSASRILDAGEPQRLSDWEVPRDLVAGACRALERAAGHSSLALEARLAALEALADAGAKCAPAAAALLGDPKPEIRRAAMLALGAQDALPAESLRRAFADPDPQVAGAAGVAWCRRQQSGSLPGGGQTLRALALAEETPVEDVSEILPCLATSSEPADRQALERLRRSTNGPLREQVAELLQGPG